MRVITDSTSFYDTNELELQEIGNDDLDHTFDTVGNMRHRDINTGFTKYIYTHDGWNRLVKVQIQDDGRRAGCGWPSGG